jgi:hypothetical protein
MYVSENVVGSLLWAMFEAGTKLSLNETMVPAELKAKGWDFSAKFLDTLMPGFAAACGADNFAVIDLIPYPPTWSTVSFTEGVA